MQTLINSWLQLWNGDYAAADGLIPDDFTLHAAMLDGGDGSAVADREALVAWIRQTRAALPDLRFTTEVGPLADGAYLAVRWRAHGTYGGGMPGAAAPVGTPVDFTGTDILRVHDGRLTEYWVNSDVHVLLKQLNVLPA
jgi:predicted ester cyclase